MRKFELHHTEVKLLLSCIDYTKSDITLKQIVGSNKYGELPKELRKLASKIRGQAT